MKLFSQTALALLFSALLALPISGTADAAANPITPTTAPSNVRDHLWRSARRLPAED